MNRTNTRPRPIAEIVNEVYKSIIRTRRTRKNRRQRSKGGEK